VPLALTGWEIGLLSAAAVFIIFALAASMLVSRRRPDFPSRYLGWFIAACIVLFVAQMTAVLLLAEVGEEHEAAAETEPGGTETEPGQTEPGETETTTGETETTTGETETTGGADTEPAPGGEGDPAAGKQVFLGPGGCGSCHTLADAGTTGTIGPILDEAKPSFDLAVERVTNGKSPMPPFKDSLSEQQIRDVAAYVSTATRG
jgi:cytochrome c6